MASVLENSASMEQRLISERFGAEFLLNRCLVDLNVEDPGDFVMRLAASPALQIPQLSTNNVRHDEEEACDKVRLGVDYLPSPMGGISFGVNPVLAPDEVVSAMAVEVLVKFPADFQWNQGGYLPGIHGVYNNLEGTSAAAPSVFESRWRWDARGKLSVMTRKATTDLNEWVATTDTKASIARDVWYCLSVAVHIDGKIHGRVNGVDVHVSSCAAGLSTITGAKLSVYCVDNADVESLEIAMKGLYIAGYVDMHVDT